MRFVFFAFCEKYEGHSQVIANRRILQKAKLMLISKDVVYDILAPKGCYALHTISLDINIHLAFCDVQQFAMTCK